MLDQAQTISWAIALRNNPDFFQSRNFAKLLLQGSRAIGDSLVVDYVQEIFNHNLYNIAVKDSKNLDKFVDSAHSWLLAHTGNRMVGLDNYQRDFSAGTTQSFDSFYWRHRQRRMRCFVGEYFYHLKSWISTNTAWSFVTDSDPLVEGDALVVSVPFCDTGNQVANLDEILETCTKLQIPVLIDCCYYTISSGINLDLAHECIDTVCFSLSKAFPVANLRIGLRYSKPGVFDGQRLMNSIGYNNSLSAYVGYKIIEKFDCAYIYNRYLQKQLAVCDFLGLSPSQSVIFALGDSQWNLYNRNNLLRAYQLDLDPGLFCNRLCLVSVYDNWDIFESVKNETVY